MGLKVMKVQDAQRANELVDALAEGIDQQQEILNGLRDTLQEYCDFLIQELKIARNEIERGEE